jgi:serine/threonine-protein kinase
VSQERLPRLLGPYALLERLGGGSYGTTYLAREISSRGPVAIKRLRDEVLHREDLRARLRHEAMVAVAIHDPHVVRALDVGVAGDVPYVAMEYVEGWPLTEVLRACHDGRQRWPARAVVAVIAATLQGLEALHGAVDPTTGTKLEAVHRDLSPNNVMLRPSGRPVLIDLGLGRSALREWETHTGMLLGTPGYMAPEQILRRVVDHRADLYAIAVLAFELLTLERYIPSADVGRMLRATCDGPFRAPSSIDASIPVALDTVLERALHVSPTARYPSAAALREALCAAVEPSVGAVERCIPAALKTAYIELNAGRRVLLAAPLPVLTDPVAQTMVFARASRRAPTAVLPGSDEAAADGPEVVPFASGGADFEATALASRDTPGSLDSGPGHDFAPTELRERDRSDETAMLASPTRTGYVEPTRVPATRVVSLDASTRPSATPRAPRRRPALLALTGVVVALSTAAVVVALSVGESAPDQAAAEPESTPAAAEPTEAPRAVEAIPGPQAIGAAIGATPVEAPEEPTPSVAPPEPEAQRGESPGPRARPIPRRPKPGSDPHPEPTRAAPSPHARLEALIERASARRRAKPEEVDALDALIADASAWLGSTDEARVSAEATRLEQKLQVLLSR